MTVLPVISSMVLSFTSFDMVSFPSFTGFNNYIRMFLHDDIFPIVFKNTVLLAILTGPAGFILSFVLAWFINEFKPVCAYNILFYVLRAELGRRCNLYGRSPFLPTHTAM